jgi:hypothetical protein
MKKNVNVFTFLFVFFVVVALGSLFVLNSSGSVFDRDSNTLGSEVAVMDQSVVGTENPDPGPEITTDKAIYNTEADNKDNTDEEKELSDAERLEQMLVEIDAEAQGNEPLQAEAEEYTDTEALDNQNDSTEDAEPSPQDGPVYYSFRVQTDGSNINLRKGPSTDSSILIKLDESAVGYVLQPGNEWTKVYTEDGWEGYLATEFLIVDRVKAEDFPEDIRSRVQEPEEVLTSAFEASG